MSVHAKGNGPVDFPVPQRVKRKNGHTRPAAPLINLSQPGRLRVAHLMALFGISHSTLYARMRSGLIPPYDGVDGRIPYWKTSTVLPLLEPESGH